MQTIHHHVCGVIPPHMLTKVAQATDDSSPDARATLEQTLELRAARAGVSADRSALAPVQQTAARKRRNIFVYSAEHQLHLPGHLVMSEHKAHSEDVEAQEAYDGCVTTYQFYESVFGRKSVDGRGMRLDSTVHYGTRFDNAMWDGKQMVYGDGDGRLFNRFTACLDVIGHELTHGVTQFSAALNYSGQSGALNEHISDAFGIMIKQHTLGQTVHQSDWLIGAGLFTHKVHGVAIRSMAAPGTAYDDPLLGRDPQPSHMQDYVLTDDDNGGVHINSGILNRAFYLAAMAIGGRAWEVLGKVWYATLTERLRADADFQDFARATVDVAGEILGNASAVQKVIAESFAEVGLPVPRFATAPDPVSRRIGMQQLSAVQPAAPVKKWRHRPLR